ncbi:MAG: DUF1707 SHOCT-like domain-containing protein [Acidimicrobiales bacterium]
MLPSQPDEPSPPAVRIGDADRDRVIDVLRVACSDGRITLDEFSDRAGHVFAARTAADLELVTRDLPVPVPVTAHHVDVSDSQATTTVIAIMNGNDRRQPWRPGDKVTAFAFWGGCTLDFRAARIDGPDVEVTAVAIMGGIDIIVPEGIEVEFSGLPIMGGTDCRLKDVPVVPGAPVLRVRAVAFWGGVSVRSKPRRVSKRVGGDRRPR